MEITPYTGALSRNWALFVQVFLIGAAFLAPQAQLLAEEQAQGSNLINHPDVQHHIVGTDWLGANPFAVDWVKVDWFGAFYSTGDEWIFHKELGWWLVLAENANLYVYDPALDCWGWTSDSVYPWIYWYEPIEEWLSYERGGRPGDRWFHSTTQDRRINESDLVSDYRDMVFVEGGTLSSSNDLDGTKIPSFRIGRNEVTWGEWVIVRDWSEENGYDWGSGFSEWGPSGCEENHPVHSVNWFEAVMWCNAKSEMQGLTPVYSMNGQVYRGGAEHPSSISQNVRSTGYRLPMNAEWEFAAAGGNQSIGYIYSGSDELDGVGWYWGNSGPSACPQEAGRGSWPVGSKAPNELGLYDMSGNVWEWCWDQDIHSTYGYIRGGSWYTSAYYASVDLESIVSQDSRGRDIGFRLVRSAPFEDPQPVEPFEMIKVEGGALSSGNSTEVSTFYIGRYEVTWSAWQQVRDWGEENGYQWNARLVGGDITGCADNHPVHSVSWFDVLKWCNARSEMEGLTPVYSVRTTSEGLVYRTGEPYEAMITQDPSANGYRLPMEIEWEFAARGGNESRDYTYAGSNELDEVGWNWNNSGWAECDLESGRGTWPVGQKIPNELGIYDMSGNVWEWCWDERSYGRAVRGGSWRFGEYDSAISTGQTYHNPESGWVEIGFRLARSSWD